MNKTKFIAQFCIGAFTTAIVLLLAFAALSLSALGAETKPLPAAKPDAKTSLYATGWEVETLAGVSTGDFQRFDGLYGVGVSYYYLPNFGLRGRILHHGWEAGHGTFVQDANVRFEARLPVMSGHLAPYGFVGAGYRIGSAEVGPKFTENFYATTGAGLEWKFTRHWSAFSEASLNANLDRRNSYGFAGGVRFGF